MYMYELAVYTQGEGPLCDKVKDASVLSLKGYKSMTLVSLRVFRTKCHTQVSALDCFQSNNKKKTL